MAAKHVTVMDQFAAMEAIAVGIIIPGKCPLGCPKCVLGQLESRFDKDTPQKKLLTWDKLWRGLLGPLEYSFQKGKAPPIIQMSFQGVDPFHMGTNSETYRMVEGTCRFAASLGLTMSAVSSGSGIRRHLDLIELYGINIAVSCDTGRLDAPIVRPAKNPKLNSFDIAVDGIRALVENKKSGIYEEPYDGKISIICVVRPGFGSRPIQLLKDFPQDLLPYIRLVLAPYVETEEGPYQGMVTWDAHEWMGMYIPVREYARTTTLRKLCIDDEENALRLVPDGNTLTESELARRPPKLVKIKAYEDGRIQRLMGRHFSTDDYRSYINLCSDGILRWTHVLGTHEVQKYFRTVGYKEIGCTLIHE